ncbi:MAG: tetratricopeptide repeat protein, partial [Desulfobacterales bacterium]
MKKNHQNTTENNYNTAVPWLEKYFLKSSAVKFFLIVLTFFTLGFLIYSNTFESPFVFDDTQRIADNPDIRLKKLGVEDLLKAAFGRHSAQSRPLGNISFALNYYFHQYELAGYHIVNIIIHIVNGILLWLFLKKTLDLKSVGSKFKHAQFIALLSALLWLVNPVQTQSVTYMVQRLNSMATMFFLLSFLFYLYGRLTTKKELRWAWFLGAAFGWLLALGCKQNTAMLPFFIFLYEWYFFQGLSKNWLKRSLKYIAVILILFGLVAFIYLGLEPWEKIKTPRDFSEGQFTMGQRLLTQTRVVIHYLGLIFYPHPSRLNLDYDFPLSYSLMSPFTTLLSLTAILGLIILGVYLAKKDRLISFCIFWFFGNLVIESSIIPLALIFEHRLYLPSMPLLLIPVTLGYRYIKLNWLRAALLCIVVIIFSVWTYQRNRVWENDLSLWTDVVSKSPNKARPKINLGLALVKRDRLDEAIHHYLKSLHIDPNYYEAHINLGVALAKQSKTNEAIDHYRRALEIKPNSLEANNDLGNALLQEGKTDEAIEHYRKALQLDPNNNKVHNNLALALASQDKTNEALIHYRIALQINPNFAEAHNNLGRELLRQGKTDEARENFIAALSLDPNLSEAHINMGIILGQQGKPNEAIEHYRKALELNPDNDEAHNNLGLAL